MIFPEWIRLEREKRGMTKSECARNASVSQPVWSEYEDTNRQNYRRETVEKIANALGVPVSEAYAAAGLTSKNWVEPDAEITNIVYGVHPSQRAAFVQAIRAMAQAMNSAQHTAA